MAGTRPRWFQVRPRFLVLLPVYVVVGLLLLLLPVAAVGWYYLLPSGSGPAGPSVPAAPFERTWHGGRVLLVAMGDSVSTGFGAGGEGYGYVDRLVRTAPDDPEDIRGRELSRVFPRLDVLNLAVNASSSFDHLHFHLPGLERQPPDVLGVVVLTTGGIDLIHDYGESPPADAAIYGASYEDGLRYGRQFRRRLEQLLDGIRARFPGGCHVFLATVFDPTDGVGDIENVHPFLRFVKTMPPWPDGVPLLAVWNRHIREVAAEREWVHVVDVHGAMLGHGIHCQDESNPHYDPDDPHHWFFVNLEDPNRRGYDAIRRVFLLEMIRVFAPAVGG